MNSGPEKMRPNPGNNAGQDSPDVGKVAVGWKMNALKLGYSIHFLPPQLSNDAGLRERRELMC